MPAWSNPQPVGVSGGMTVIADLGNGLGHDALVDVQLIRDYATHHPPGYPFREDPGAHGSGDVLWLLKPEADALVAQGVAVYAGSIASAPPVNVDLPYASGPDGSANAGVGDTVTVTTGNWENKPNSYAYQWKRRTGANVNALPDATEASYVPVKQDKAKPVFCSVMAINEVGEAAADSNDVHVDANVAALDEDEDEPAAHARRRRR
jgi:hypothetical protein